MPSTPVFAIPYPCSGSTISPADIADWANSIDAAISSVNLNAQAALTRPSMYAESSRAGQSIATGVTTNIIFTTVTFADGFTGVVPTTTFTAVEAGIYRADGQVSMTQPIAATTTRFQVILNAGTQRASRNLNLTDLTNSDPPLLTEGIFICPAGTVFSLTVQWIGTGGPIPVFGTLTVNKISDL